MLPLRKLINLCSKNAKQILYDYYEAMHVFHDFVRKIQYAIMLWYHIYVSAQIKRFNAQP